MIVCQGSKVKTEARAEPRLRPLRQLEPSTSHTQTCCCIAPSEYAVPAQPLSSFYLSFLIKGILCWNGQNSPPSSLAPLDLAEISDLRPEEEEEEGGDEGSVSKKCYNWEGEGGLAGTGLTGLTGHSVLVDEAASRFPM